jgi:hypothetical protein
LHANDLLSARCLTHRAIILDQLDKYVVRLSDSVTFALFGLLGLTRKAMAAGWAELAKQVERMDRERLLFDQDK